MKVVRARCSQDIQYEVFWLAPNLAGGTGGGSKDDYNVQRTTAPRVGEAFLAFFVFHVIGKVDEATSKCLKCKGKSFRVRHRSATCPFTATAAKRSLRADLIAFITSWLAGKLPAVAVVQTPAPYQRGRLDGESMGPRGQRRLSVLSWSLDHDYLLPAQCKWLAVRFSPFSKLEC